MSIPALTLAAASPAPRNDAVDYSLNLLTRLLYGDASVIADRATYDLRAESREFVTAVTDELALFLQNLCSRQSRTYGVTSSLSAAVGEALAAQLFDERQSRRVLGALADARWAATPSHPAPGAGSAGRFTVEDVHTFVHAAGLSLRCLTDAGGELGWYLNARTNSKD
jgi:hypothetical protein